MLNGWVNANDTSPIDSERRAVDAWRRIMRNPVSITVIRNSKEDVSEQFVRIEYEERQDQRGGTTTRIGANRVTIFGVRDHPTMPDTDLQKGDTFSHAGSRYEIVTIALYPGEIQALSEVR